MADRLSLDSAAAIKAGMSYGQWKALHPHTEGESYKIAKKKQIPCAFCGKLFDVAQNRKYCSMECYYEKNRIAYSEKAAEGKRRRYLERKAKNG